MARYENNRGNETHPQPGTTTPGTTAPGTTTTFTAREPAPGDTGRQPSPDTPGTQGEGLRGRFHRAASQRLNQGLAGAGGEGAPRGPIDTVGQGDERRGDSAFERSGAWRRREQDQDEGWRDEGRGERDPGRSRYETDRDWRTGRDDSPRYARTGPDAGRERGWSEDRSPGYLQEDRGQYYTGRQSSQGWDAEGRGHEGREGGRPRGRWQREPLTAREIMTRNPRSVRRDSALRDAAQIMKDENCGIVPVVDERGRLVGVLTDRDIVMRGFADNKTPETFRVSDVMTDDVEAVTPDDDIHGLIDLMGRKQIRRIPVVEQDDRLVGIVAMSDLATRADYDEDLQDALERISSRRSFWSRFFS